MVDRSRRDLGDHRRESGGSPLRNKHPVNPGSLGSPEDRAEIVRIFHAVEDDQQGRLVPCGCTGEYRLFRLIGFRGGERDDSLVTASRDQPVKRGQGLDMDGDTKRARHLDEICELFVGPDHEETLQQSGPGL
jgi:hypothetical protein